MLSTDVMEYANLKLTLLQRFRLTAEVYRGKLRKPRSGKTESMRRLPARTPGYFDRRMKMEGTGKVYEELQGRVFAEQLLSTCSEKLAVLII